MERKSKGSGFKLRSGNMTSFKMMGATKLNRTMDKSSVSDGRAKSSAFQKEEFPGLLPEVEIEGGKGYGEGELIQDKTAGTETKTGGEFTSIGGKVTRHRELLEKQDDPNQKLTAAEREELKQIRTDVEKAYKKKQAAKK